MGISERRCLRAARHGINVARSRSALRWCAVATLPLRSDGLHWAVLDPRGPVGQADRTILIDSLAIMLAIGVPTILATFAFAWWFRASNTRARYRPDWEFSGAIELVVWSIPCMVIILLGGVAWLGSYELDPAKPLVVVARQPLEIQVVSLDWKWLFIYPRGGRREREPARRARRRAAALLAHLGERLERLLRAAARQHDLHDERHAHPAVPACRRARARFRGMSAHFSGDGFSDMHFPVRSCAPTSSPPGSRSTRGAGPTLDAASYAALARQSATLPPSTYGAVTPELFDQVVRPEDPARPRPGDRARRRRGGITECAQERGQRQMFGKLTWSAIPFHEPIVMVTSAVVAMPSRPCSPG